MRTSASNRTCAMSILNQATRALHTGQKPTRDLLVDLAHYTLCTRFHQGQAEGLAEKWWREIECFLVEQARLERQELTSLWDRVEKLLAGTERGLGQGQERQVQTPGSIFTAPTTPAQAPPRTRFASATPRLETTPSTASATNRLPVGGSPARLVSPPASTSTASPALGDAAQRGVETRSQTRTRETRAREVESGESHSATGHEETADDPRSTNNGSMVPAVLSRLRHSSIPTPPSRATTSPTGRTATRRTIEGNCSICFEPLQKARCGPSSLSCSEDEINGHGVSATVADGEASRPVNDTPERDGDSGEEKEHAELSWCKAQCGVNYHAKCIKLWLAAATRSTCPTCRGPWRDEPATQAGVA
ncbi:hypothetical protein BDW75DRAFT_7114 [Aspergillus navahoensis]